MGSSATSDHERGWWRTSGGPCRPGRSRRGPPADRRPRAIVLERVGDLAGHHGGVGQRAAADRGGLPIIPAPHRVRHPARRRAPAPGHARWSRQVVPARPHPELRRHAQEAHVGVDDRQQAAQPSARHAAARSPAPPRWRARGPTSPEPGASRPPHRGHRGQERGDGQADEADRLGGAALRLHRPQPEPVALPVPDDSPESQPLSSRASGRARRRSA